MGSKPENTFLSYLTVLFFSQNLNWRASLSRAHHWHPATSPIHALSHQHIGTSRNPLVVLHQPRNSGLNSQLLGFTRNVLRLILPLTTISLIQLFINKIRLLFVPYQAGCIQKSICGALVRTPSRVIGIRASFRQADTLLCLFFSILMSLSLQQVSIGSELTENFDGPETVTSVAPSPGLRVLQQRIEAVDTTGRRCETIVLETDRTTLSRILFSIP